MPANFTGRAPSARSRMCVYVRPDRPLAKGLDILLRYRPPSIPQHTWDSAPLGIPPAPRHRPEHRRTGPTRCARACAHPCGSVGLTTPTVTPRPKWPLSTRQSGGSRNSTDASRPPGAVESGGVMAIAADPDTSAPDAGSEHYPQPEPRRQALRERPDVPDRVGDPDTEPQGDLPVAREEAANRPRQRQSSRSCAAFAGTVIRLAPKLQRALGRRLDLAGRSGRRRGPRPWGSRSCSRSAAPAGPSREYRAAVSPSDTSVLRPKVLTSALSPPPPPPPPGPFAAANETSSQSISVSTPGASVTTLSSSSPQSTLSAPPSLASMRICSPPPHQLVVASSRPSMMSSPLEANSSLGLSSPRRTLETRQYCRRSRCPRISSRSRLPPVCLRAGG